MHDLPRAWTVLHHPSIRSDAVVIPTGEARRSFSNVVAVRRLRGSLIIRDDKEYLVKYTAMTAVAFFAATIEFGGSVFAAVEKSDGKAQDKCTASGFTISLY